MVLIVTTRADLTADWLILEFERRRTAYVRFNTEDFPQRCKVAWRPDQGFVLAVGARTFAASEIGAVWYRRPVAPRIAPGLPPAEEAWVLEQASETLDGLWRTLETCWVSHPDALLRAGNKLEQLWSARRLGFSVPDTEVTNDPDRLEDLFARSPSGVVCKSLRDGRVSDDGLLYTSEVARDRVGELRDEPLLFQALVPKQYDVRVTVIGDEVFAMRIEPPRHGNAFVDWRRADITELTCSVEALPDEVSGRCHALVAAYGLRFGAIDLARRPDGGYTFFELNPNGQWAWVEQLTRVPLRACLADLLVGS